MLTTANLLTCLCVFKKDLQHSRTILSACCRSGSPPPEELTFPEDVDGPGQHGHGHGAENSNWKICANSDGSVDTIISCVKLHISGIEIFYWRLKRDCPVDETQNGRQQKQLDPFRKIIAQYEKNEVSA